MRPSLLRSSIQLLNTFIAQSVQRTVLAGTNLLRAWSSSSSVDTANRDFLFRLNDRRFFLGGDKGGDEVEEHEELAAIAIAEPQ